VLQALGLPPDAINSFVLEMDPVPRALLSVDPTFQALSVSDPARERETDTPGECARAYGWECYGTEHHRLYIHIPHTPAPTVEYASQIGLGS
jgi:hypothetical protein